MMMRRKRTSEEANADGDEEDNYEDGIIMPHDAPEPKTLKQNVWLDWGDFTAHLQQDLGMCAITVPSVMAPATLLGAHVCFRWDVGWAAGVVSRRVKPNAKERTEGYNAVVQYEGERELHLHNLTLDTYQTGANAPDGSWAFLTNM